MSKLTAEQIAQHAYDAGFRGENLTTAVAVAMAESSGNTKSHNDTPPDDSYGLWQINMLGDMGPARRKEFGLDSNKDLFDPAENAKAAYEIAGDGKDFGPWSTYTNGAYKKHLDEAEKAAKKAGQGSGGGSGGGQGGGTGGQGSGGGFSANPEALRKYAERAEGIADALEGIGKRTVHSVTGIAKDSFGKVGAETGFSDALGGFSKGLEKQVRTTGSNARKLGEGATDAAKTYQEIDERSAAELKRIMG
ncbi:transglycosylase SLT domain-containing protein [Saccharopolyspora indica]|uniref:transglycosylase SLT domain-containing protein n=1 Tax=Saccharopolyspora indica TaxID=1229659 RepID=UPI0022EABA0E|nr:transglycosylase SLT domain-containing protein [Saccharopolyspora indica]MDA3645651.1 transglycosylase SLT domain-containing protein [Saccharopolyspora indica]